jgi:hypothetical protein
VRVFLFVSDLLAELHRLAAEVRLPDEGVDCVHLYLRVQIGDDHALENHCDEAQEGVQDAEIEED